MNQLSALLLTLLIELPCVWLVSRRWAASAPRPLPRLLAVAALAQLLTHPFAWHGHEWLASRLSQEQALQGWLAIESLVVLVEAVVLTCGLSWRWQQGLAASLFSNAASATAGYVLLGASHALA